MRSRARLGAPETSPSSDPTDFSPPKDTTRRALDREGDIHERSNAHRAPCSRRPLSPGCWPGWGPRGQPCRRGPVLKKIETLTARPSPPTRRGDSEAAKKVLMDAVVLGKENGLAEDTALGPHLPLSGPGAHRGAQGRGARRALLHPGPADRPRHQAEADAGQPGRQPRLRRGQRKRPTELRAQGDRQPGGGGHAAEEAGSQTEGAQARAGSDAKESKKAETPKRRGAGHANGGAGAREEGGREPDPQGPGGQPRAGGAGAGAGARAPGRGAAAAKLEREQKAQGRAGEDPGRAGRDQGARGQGARAARPAGAGEAAPGFGAGGGAGEEGAREKEQLGRNKQELEKRQLAETQQREKAERAAKEQLAKDKEALEKQLATEKTRMQNELKEMSKQLAATTEREKKERAARKTCRRRSA